ncbi:AI-2E family transporter [Bacillus sp. B1-b2]|uniref:AI-2E family transporter n=1 Tax=Bacillus sp. B1-b2 TaxID=2653201 RepID=UPI001262593F|nr:AI-2E family transporter [Bacillus sp. B1-b2]KAB7667277.1 AI-2E family transporter [Bacillus sp. B1-b2]
MDIRIKWYYRLGFTLLLFIVLFVFIKLAPIWLPILSLLTKVVSPFIIGAFITYLLHPIIELLHRKGFHRGLAVALIYIIFFGGIGYGIYKGIPVLIQQLEALSDDAPELARNYKHLIQSIQDRMENWPVNIQEKVDNGINHVEIKLEALLNKIMNGAMGFINSSIVIMLIPFISFYMLKDIEVVKKASTALTPKKWRRSLSLFLKDVNTSLGSYIRGQLLVCTIIGILCCLLFWFFDLKFPLVLGIIIGITNVIPYFGPIIGAVPAVIIAITMSTKMLIIVIIIIIILQFLEGNILSPYIVGRSTHMHPLMIMFALLLGEEVGGIIGMIVAVPILSIAKVAILHFKKHFGSKEQHEKV